MADSSRQVRSKPTIPEVAVRAGVSRATAGRVLGGYGPTSEDARERVLAAAEELGYEANVLARSMVTGRTDTVGLVIADINNPFFSQVTRSFCDVCRREGFEVLILNTDEQADQERHAFRILRERRVDGIAVSLAYPNDLKHVRQSLTQGLPVVLLDRGERSLRCDSVVIDNAAAAATAVAHLADVGHELIGVVTDSSRLTPELTFPQVDARFSSYQDRLVGYAEELRKRGIEVRAEYIRTALNRDGAHRCVDELLDLPNPPTGIVVSDGAVGLWIVERLQERGVRCPEDISVVVFDDVDWTRVVRPRMTVVAQPLQELGDLAARSLIERVRGYSGQPRNYVLNVSLIERDSTGAVSMEA